MRTVTVVMLYVMFFLYALCAGIGWYYQLYQNEKDLDAVVSRAQVAADASDMLGYMRVYRENLQRERLTSGYTALIFTKPTNDLGLHFKAVTRIIERLEMVTKLNHAETAYQVALDDLRGTIRELEPIAAGVTWITLHWLLWVGIVLVLPVLCTLAVKQ